MIEIEIAGGPGTGKTPMAQEFADVFSKSGKSVGICDHVLFTKLRNNSALTDLNWGYAKDQNFDVLILCVNNDEEELTINMFDGFRHYLEARHNGYNGAAGKISRFSVSS